MLYVLTRGHERLCYEIRLIEHGAGYELCVRYEDAVRAEQFGEMDGLLARERELLLAWRADGWEIRSHGGGRERSREHRHVAHKSTT